MDGRHAKWAQDCQDAIRADLNDPASADFPSPVVDAGWFVLMQVADAEKGGDPFKMAPAAMLAWTDKHPELSSETVSFKFHAKNLMGGVQRYTAFCTFTDNFDGTTRMTQQAAGLAGGMLPMDSSSWRWLNQSTHSSVAYSTASKLRHGPRLWITSAL